MIQLLFFERKSDRGAGLWFLVALTRLPPLPLTATRETIPAPRSLPPALRWVPYHGNHPPHPKPSTHCSHLPDCMSVMLLDALGGQLSTTAQQVSVELNWPLDQLCPWEWGHLPDPRSLENTESIAPKASSRYLALTPHVPRLCEAGLIQRGGQVAFVPRSTEPRPQARAGHSVLQKSQPGAGPQGPEGRCPASSWCLLSGSQLPLVGDEVPRTGRVGVTSRKTPHRKTEKRADYRQQRGERPEV